MENNQNEQEQIFIKLRRNESPQRTIHIEWEDLSDVFSELLSELLCREITAEAEREEYYYWNVNLSGTPISRQELEILFKLVSADEFDREQNDFGEYPIMELCEELCNKLMRRLLPCKIISVRADDEGVWFIGEEIADRSELKPLMQEQIAECLRMQRPLYHFVPGNPDGSGWITLSTEDPDDWDYGKVDGYGTEYIAYDREPDTNWPF